MKITVSAASANPPVHLTTFLPIPKKTTTTKTHASSHLTSLSTSQHSHPHSHPHPHPNSHPHADRVPFANQLTAFLLPVDGSVFVSVDVDVNADVDVDVDVEYGRLVTPLFDACKDHFTRYNKNKS